MEVYSSSLGKENGWFSIARFDWRIHFDEIFFSIVGLLMLLHGVELASTFGLKLRSVKGWCQVTCETKWTFLSEWWLCSSVGSQCNTVQSFCAILERFSHSKKCGCVPKVNLVKKREKDIQPFRKEWSWPGFTFSALQKPNWMTRWLVIFPMAVYDAVRSSNVLMANVCERKQQTHDPNGNDRQNERNTNIPNRPYNVAKKNLTCVRSVDLTWFFRVFFDCAIPAQSLARLWNSRGKAQLEGKGGLAILITSNDFQSLPNPSRAFSCCEYTFHCNGSNDFQCFSFMSRVFPMNPFFPKHGSNLPVHFILEGCCIL